VVGRWRSKLVTLVIYNNNNIIILHSYQYIFIIHIYFTLQLTVGNKSKLSFRDTATCSATSHNEKIVQSIGIVYV